MRVAGKLLPDTNAFIALSAGDVLIQVAPEEADEIILAAAVLRQLR